MGATTFFVKSKGKTVEEAFQRAVADACWRVGHGGYSGTIAEKDSFVVVEVPVGEQPEQYAQELVDNDDPRIRDKWGPAGAVKLRDGDWAFFGWASA